MKLRLTPAAEADIREVYMWYREQGGGLAQEFRRALDACLARIRRNRFSHPKVYGQLRRALLSRFPYAVFYVIGEEEIAVLGVFHGRRDPKVWQRRHDA
ncbi:type II toxin-antitoxin system RelE/ParE family toxin [Acidobacteria bacterium AH-259-L09]|nr:type II toxin-antitoxin system RelE/ParE family toxin [Acidobacteria bacterium AH-259-L09]